jgi:hypothetical protein
MALAGHYPVIRRTITITTANQGIRFREGATTSTKTVTPGTYYLGRSGSDSILAALKTALEVGASANTYTWTATPVTTPTGLNVLSTLTRASGADDFQLLGADALTTFPLDAVGFAEVNTALDASAKVGTVSASGWWVGNDMLAVDEADVMGDVYGDDPSRGGLVVAGAHSDEWVMRRWGLQYVHRARTWREHNPTDHAATWEDFWGRWVRSGTVLELARLPNGAGSLEEWDTVTSAFTSSPTTIGKWVGDKASRIKAGPIRRSAGSPIYAWPLVFQQWVSP